MVLYHFTAHAHIDKIRRKGLRLGIIPWALRRDNSGFNFVPGWQWLTQDPDWVQEWDAHGTGSGVPYRRTDWRITVEVPSLYEHRCIRWEAYALKMRPPSAEQYFAHFAARRFWYVYHGTIPPAWFIATERNPNLMVLDEEFRQTH